MGLKKYANKIQRRKARQMQQQEYHKRTTKMVAFRFMLIEDKDILDRLNQQTNKTDYVRCLIRKDIEEDE